RRLAPVDGLHGDADDRERLLPDLPVRRARRRRLDRAADGDDDALGDRARRPRVPDPRAGARIRAGDPDRAAALRVGAAPRLASAARLRADVRARRRRRPADRDRPGRARRLAARDPRRLPRRRRDALPLLAGRPVVLVPDRRPRPLVRGRAARGDDRARRPRARPGPPRAGVPRRRDRGHLLADARGLGVRLGAPAARRGAKHLLRRAVVPDRAARLDRPRRSSAGALPRVLPFTRLITTNAVSDTLTILPIWSLQTALFPIEETALVVVLACICAAGLFVLVPRRYALVLPGLILVYFAVSQKPIEGKHETASVGALFAGITLPRDWVDHRVGYDARVTTIWSGQTSAYAIWENEIFNRSLRRFYYLHSQLAGDLPEQKLKVDPETGVMTSGGRPVRSRYVLTDSSVQLGGRELDQDPHTGMTLYETRGPLRQVSQVTGLYPNDTWSGRYASYTRLGCRGGTLTVGLQSDHG